MAREHHGSGPEVLHEWALCTTAMRLHQVANYDLQLTDGDGSVLVARRKKQVSAADLEA
jgi:hypothetical protein